MGQMLSVVAGGVPPAAVCVKCALLCTLKGQMTISLIEATAAALALEVIDNIRQRVAF